MSLFKFSFKNLSLITLVFTSMLVFAFQNCGTSGTTFDSTDSTSQSLQNLEDCTDKNCEDIKNGVGKCSFNGQTIDSGASVEAFLTNETDEDEECKKETRTCTNGSLSGTYTYATCSEGNDDPIDCSFNGATVKHGASVNAYLMSTPTSGSSCLMQTRTCNNGALSGSYSYASCTEGQASCLFNGRTILSGNVAIAYQNSTVSAGEACVSENRLCVNGQLKGSYAYGSCAPAAAASCLFEGKTIASGDSVLAYKNSVVGAGQSCVPESRSCKNGVLSGSFNFGSCVVGAPASCEFNGKSIVSGESVVAYQSSTVAVGKLCVVESRACNNGQLSGSYAFASCSPGAPASCEFNGKTIASGQSVLAYLNSTVAVGSNCQAQSRVCTNGSLSGSYNYAACKVDAAESCSFGGKTIASGSAIVAYLNSTVPFGSTCKAESRACSNGELSGSYAYTSCVPGSPAACLFNGKTVAHGAAVTGYQTSSVAFGQSCVSQARACNNGALSGTFAYGSCTVGEAKSCTFNGKTIANGESVVGYKISSVPFGSACEKQSRTCTDGVLSGTYPWNSCAVDAAKSCSLNGVTIAHGQSTVAYKTASVEYGATCSKETRTCNNGSLSGSYTVKTCTVGTAKSCKFGTQTVAHAASVTAYKEASVAYGQSCVSQKRTCDNGDLSGSYLQASCKEDKAKDCTFNGEKVVHGATIVGYKVAESFSCKDEKESRKCTNGTLAGSAKYSTCKDVANVVWVNSDGHKSHSTVCTAKGMKVASNQGAGICASGEARPKENPGWNSINYINGTWGGASTGGINVTVRTVTQSCRECNRTPITYYSCYRKDQKHDNDGTDIAIAYLCERK